MRQGMQVLFLMVWLATSVVACAPPANTPSTASSTTQSTEVSTMLTLNLMLDQTRYSQGSSVNATVVLQNVGPETLVVNSRLAVNFSVAPTELQELAFVVTQPSGQVSKYEVLAQVRAPKATNFVALGPNEQVAKVIALDKIYPMPELGVYTVQAVYHNAVTPSDGRTAWQGEIKSNVVTFELTP